jgi:hypothetical protein
MNNLLRLLRTRRGAGLTLVLPQLRGRWLSLNITGDVRFWHLADMTEVVGDVRFGG